METLNIIKELCLKNEITVAKLEMELGFSNGSIAKSKIKSMSSERLMAIAEYFGVPMEYLMGKEVGYYTNEETARVAQELFSNKEMKLLFDAASDATPEDLKMAYDMLLALKRKENKID